MFTASMPRPEPRAPVQKPQPVRAPALLHQYRLERVVGRSTYLSAANDDDAKRKAFKLLGVEKGMTPQLFFSRGGKRLMKLGANEQQIYPPLKH